MSAGLLKFEMYLKILTDITAKKIKLPLVILILFILLLYFILQLYIIQLNNTSNLLYASESVVSVNDDPQKNKVSDQLSQQNLSQQNLTKQNLTQNQQHKVPLTSASKSKIYPVAVIRQLTQIAASKEETIKQLSDWSKKIIPLIDELILNWENKNFTDIDKNLDSIRLAIFELDSLRKSLPNLDSSTKIVTDNNSKDSSKISRTNLKYADNILSENYIPETITLETLQYGLERRYIFWKYALNVENSESFPVSANLDKTDKDLDKLLQLTLTANKFLLKNKYTTPTGEKIGELWCNYFETTELIANLESYKKSIQADYSNSEIKRKILENYLESFCSTINVILYRFTDIRLTKKQLLYLKSPSIHNWRLELERWWSDTILPVSLLSKIEQYEDNVGMSDMQDLFRSATRMAFAKSDDARKFGLIVHKIYGGSNVKLYVSKVLVNHLVPSPENEVKSFREYIQNQEVVGKRESDFDVKVNFIPDSERLLFSLDVEGSIATISRTNAFATTIFNKGEAKCTAQKQVELTEEGFQFLPTEVKISSNKLQLQRIRTEFDGLPLISNLVRSIVFNQYELRYNDAKNEAGTKIRRQVKQRIDRETRAGFAGFNDKFNNLIDVSNNDFGISIEKKDSITEEHWLLTSWAIRSSGILSGNTPAPATLRGSFADMKIHESAINAIISKLDIAGKTDTVGNFRKMLAEQFRYNDIAEPGENDDVLIGFDKYNPVVVRFVDGVIELAISIDSLRMDRQTYRDFQVFIRYEPIRNENGELMLKRRGVISLEKTKIGSQIVLRAVFGKIFPEEKTFSLTPKFLKENKKFEGLTTGLCRIGKGWFAIALVNSAVSVENPLISDNVPNNRFER
ncbi:MAG: hypothetical protein LBE18_05910 [Planctomycetaceae bacterium]|jgi:hypothetical protein|nr:hypothetical protein [Planctomycetaceae bacterium]